MSSTSTGEVGSFKLSFNSLSSTSEAISIKYFELKLIFNVSELNSALIFSLPSPELALFTESCTLSLLIVSLTPSFPSSDTLATLSIEFINSFSFIFSPRPGTTAANFELIDKKISLTRLEKVQKQLFTNQINLNKSLEGKEIDVLVENKIDGGTKFFGRSEHMTSVIFDGNNLDMGNVIKVKINRSNQNTLFGKSLDNSEQRVA